jgi:acyl-CoA reductase-like NAD-dependent aldehyde dehydrogenase
VDGCHGECTSRETGYKQSGWGREMGHAALEAYTEVKEVTTLL